jgi:molecular chaperone DnaK
MGKVIGIDLGTTNSAAAVMEGSTPAIIPTQEGDRLTPSIVAVDKNGTTLVGKLAKNQAVTNPDNTIHSSKRFIGRNFSDDEVKDDTKHVSYQVKEGKNGEVLIEMGGKDYRPEEVAARVLQKIKTDAEAYLGQTVTEAVITVPAYFNDSQRQATKDAGRIAGLEVKRILNEPTAAALAYGLNNKKEGKVAVFDLGGGTFDITVLDIGDGVFEVLATNGDTHLGGEDFDQKIIAHLIEQFKSETGIDLGGDKLALQRLKEATQKAKHELSTVTTAEINIPFITADSSGPKHLEYKLTRAKLEELAKSLIDRTVEPCKKAMADAKVSESDITDVILVGGMTRMPAVREKVKQIFNKEPNQSVNPDEAVAVGAALQAGIIQGDVKDILLLDVTPLSLGIETRGGVTNKIIPRNTTIPTQKSQIYSTASDNQTSVEIHVVQGEREMAVDNKTLGRFILDGIPPAPMGVPQIEVTFDIDANGILNVTAKDKATGKSQKIVIQASSGLTESEIRSMTKDAETNAEADKKRRELAETINESESLIYGLEKLITEQGDKVSAEDKKEAEEKISQLRESLKQEGLNPEEHVSKIKSLVSEINKVSERIYKGMGGGAQDQGNPGQDSQGSEDGPQDNSSTK